MFSRIDILLASESRDWRQRDIPQLNSTYDPQLSSHSRWPNGHDPPTEHFGTSSDTQALTSCSPHDQYQASARTSS